MRVEVSRRTKADLLSATQRAYKLAAERLAEQLLSLVQERFKAQSDPWGSAWRPLSETSLELLARGGLKARVKAARRGSAPTRYAMRGSPPSGGLGGRRLLQDTGRLLGSLHRPEGTSKVLTGVVYAAVHQFGNPDNRLPNTARGRPAPIPARPFFPMRKGGGVDLPAAWRDALLDAAVDVVRRVMEL